MMGAGLGIEQDRRLELDDGFLKLSPHLHESVSCDVSTQVNQVAYR
jgi:hypothetical protein